MNAELYPRPLASRLARLAAVVIDSLIAGILSAGPTILGLPIGPLRDRPPVPGAGVVYAVAVPLGLILLVVQCYLLTTRGHTLGKMAMGVRIVDYVDGGNPGFVRVVLLRYFVTFLLYCIPCIGQIFLVVDILWIFGDERRCLHDKIAGTSVVVA